MPQQPRVPFDPATQQRLVGLGWQGADGLVEGAEELLAELRRGPDPDAALGRLLAILETEPALAADALADARLGASLLAIAGASRALSSIAAADPEALRAAAAHAGRAFGSIGTGGDPETIGGLLRNRVHAGLLAIAAADLTGAIDMPTAGRMLSDLADRAAETALEHSVIAARADDRFSDLPEVPIAVIAMGKWGGRELNYASDIDVLFVYAVPARHDADSAALFSRRVAEGFLGLLGTPTREGIAFRVDPDLRPEGRSGPLARTLDSYLSYWERWAETWELQALLKARPAAGDAALGRAFVAAAETFVFPETLGADAVGEVRSMKARTEALADRIGTAVELKRGVGGIRDVEFSVQLLQLVHGRTDVRLRSANTLDALGVLADDGYVRPEDAASLADAYHWLRNLEHRLQLYDLRQTHTLPPASAERERVAKAMGYRDRPDSTALERFEADLVERRATVRTIHEQLFYRPLLEAFADSPAVRLTEEGAARQLAALGFLDAEGARRAFHDLTGGLSRRSSLMQQMLPLMLDWLSEAPDPDLGLSQLRLLVTSTADNNQLIAAMRDNPVAAERLCMLLGTSRLLGRLLDRIPPSLAIIGNDDRLTAFPSTDGLMDEIRRRVVSRASPKEQQEALRRFTHGYLLWIAGRDLVGFADAPAVGLDLASLADAVAAAAFGIARDAVAKQGWDPPPMALIAMGKWGGRELNYASDLDALVVHRTVHDPADDAAAAQRVAEAFVSVVGALGADGPGWEIDLDLRPEGKRGPLTRSIDSYRTYYERWAETWEFQALLRARWVAGDPDPAAAFMDLVRPLAYPRSLESGQLRDIRAMKARIERERIPAGEDPAFHMKLGRGGMADIEWTAQLLQMRHGSAVPDVRTTATRDALSALADAGFLARGRAEVLLAAYDFCARVRNRLYLQAGRQRDSLPGDPAEVTRLARSLGYRRSPRATLREDYRRVTRRARRVVSAVFYEA